MKSYSEEVSIDFRWSMGMGNKILLGWKAILYLEITCNRYKLLGEFLCFFEFVVYFFFLNEKL